MHSKLTGDCSASDSFWGLVLVLVGSEVMGESVLARRFVHTYKEQYPYAMWFDAESKESIEFSFLNALAALLGLTSSSRDKAGGLQMKIE